MSKDKSSVTSRIAPLITGVKETELRIVNSEKEGSSILLFMKKLSPLFFMSSAFRFSSNLRKKYIWLTVSHTLTVFY